jgi:subfamily B ATP-binding cassette protein MsbA
MANLLPGFYHNEQGHILIDGTDIRDYKLESLRANIAFVTQEVVLFNDTIRNNIAYGAMRNCSDSEIEEAVRSAHALEFIQELPDGLNTVIGERGLRLSGGQRQRLAIARALLKNAPILILDEATSSLDTESERHIQAALETLRKGRTCIIIAHRLSTIENADRIIVIEHGKIVQTGTHAELIKKDGLYARLHKVQFSESP